MKSKIILVVSLLVTLVATSANAQPVRERRQHNDVVGKDFRHGRISNHDRHHSAREKAHYRKNNFRGGRDGRFSHHDRRYLRHGNRKFRHHSYGYRPHSQNRKFYK